MNLRIQIIIAVVIILALFVIINMIRKKALELRYALTWLAVGVIVLILDIFPGIMGWMSGAMGIELPTNMLFFMGFCFLLMLVFGLTIKVSKISDEVKRLTQEMAILQYDIEEKQKNAK